jgi:hypothetical protein
MRHDTNFSVRYLTDDPVPIRDIIDSLHGVETLLGEMSHVLPRLIDGLEVTKIHVRVREISQHSPLGELFLVSLFLAFQDDLEKEIPENLSKIAGYPIPDNMDTIVTVCALTLAFYGVGAIKDLVLGNRHDGPARKMLDSLIDELAENTGKTQKQIRKLLEDRYRDKTLWHRITFSASRFFTPSKRQNSSALEVNDRPIEREIVQDIPEGYLFENAAEVLPFESFTDVVLELHAQDRDHSGKGWAAVPRGVCEDRLRLKLMTGVKTSDLWGHDNVRGDITVIYDKVGEAKIPKEVHLHSVRGIGE